MNLVQPIRDKDIIEEIKEILKERNYRNYILFMIGINTGLRISDILRLRVRDVKGWRITIRMKKTGEIINLKMPKPLKKDLRDYIKDKPDNEYLIKSRIGKNKPISRKMAYVILSDVAREFDLDSIGCHSLRKTFGYHLYQKRKDVASLQELFGHEDPSYTLRYIGINQDTLDSIMDSFAL